MPKHRNKGHQQTDRATTEGVATRQEQKDSTNSDDDGARPTYRLRRRGVRPNYSDDAKSPPEDADSPSSARAAENPSRKAESPLGRRRTKNRTSGGNAGGRKRAGGAPPATTRSSKSARRASVAHGGTKERADYQALWRKRLEELKEFKERTGHCEVPYRYADNPQLGRWAKKQQSQYRAYHQKGKRSLMTEARVKELERLGFYWGTSNEDAWENKFEDLQKFRAVRGHCNVPRRYKNDPSLGTWVNMQRVNYKRYQEGNPSGRMTPERIRRLESIGFNWWVRGGKENKEDCEVGSDNETQLGRMGEGGGVEANDEYDEAEDSDETNYVGKSEGVDTTRAVGEGNDDNEDEGSGSAGESPAAGAETDDVDQESLHDRIKKAKDELRLWLRNIGTDGGLGGLMENQYAAMFEGNYRSLSQVAETADSFGVEKILDTCKVTHPGDRGSLAKAIMQLNRDNN